MVACNAQQKDPTNNGASITHGRIEEQAKVGNDQNFPDIEPARQFAKKLTRKEQY